VVGRDRVRVVTVPGTHVTMMEGVHQARLGRALDGTLADARAPRPTADASPLVTLRFGRAGTRAPLFCVPGAGANVASFAELVEALDPAWPVHGLQPRGLAGDGVPHATVEAAASYYLRAVEEAAPSGPVHLLGHSFGGWVAFEMAARLATAGRPVASLTMVDTDAPTAEGVVEEFDAAEAYLKLVEVFEQSAERSLDIGAREAAMDEAGRLRVLHERLVRLGMMPARSTPDVLRGPLRTFGAALRASYRPSAPYAHPVRLVLVDDPRRDVEANAAAVAATVRAWTRWAPALAFTPGAGNHMTVLKAPHAAALARLLGG
jgi:thioesterase domain-containing protein